MAEIFLDTAELKEKAKKIVSAEQEKDIFNRKNELSAKIKSLQTQIVNEQENLLVNEQKIIELYEKSQEKLNKTALANGFMTSTIYMDKTAYLENEKQIDKIEKQEMMEEFAGVVIFFLKKKCSSLEKQGK